MGAKAGGGRSWPAAVLLAVCGAAPAAAQKEGKPPELPPPVDPYTQGERAALDRAGYVSFGPFQFGDGQTSAKIDELLGFPLVWVETAHFKLGSSLEKYPLKTAEADEREKLREDLARLREKLPTVKPKPRELDPWLRLHLFAMRLEELYADFAERFAPGVEFPAEGGPRGDLGMGPYLGQPDKFSVLLFERESTYGRFTAHFLGEKLRVPVRHNFHETGSLFYGMCVDPLEGGYATDTAVHCNTVAGVVHNLVDGFRYYGHEPPLWWREGLGHFYSRRIDGRWNVYTGKDDGRIEDEDAWEWEPRVRARVKFGVFPAWAEMLAWSDPLALTRPDHMIAWSRVDWLLAHEAAGAAAFMMAIKAPRAPGFDPGPEQELELQTQAFTAAFGATPEDVDRAWSKHVLDRYPTR